uniref:Uncharacterized protein n=1 Tax=viral metagenome TaxID=1070528 RepID=A0A6C0JTJ9_9ZZZZ
MIKNRQFDIPLTPQHVYSIPTTVKGRLTAEDYIYFQTDGTVDLPNYTMAVQTYQGDIRNVGVISDKILLPHVRFPDSSMFLLLTTSQFKPKFMGTLERGKTYFVSLRNAFSNTFYVLR